MVDKTASKCQHPGANHSGDTVSVSHGSSKRLRLCGFHASQLDARTFAMLRDRGVIS